MGRWPVLPKLDEENVGLVRFQRWSWGVEFTPPRPFAAGRCHGLRWFTAVPLEPDENGPGTPCAGMMGLSKPTENTGGTKPVAHNDTVFAQVLKLVPRHEFESLARKHKSGRMSPEHDPLGPVRGTAVPLVSCLTNGFI